MNQLILACGRFLKDFRHTYAICGGYALEMFADKKMRAHSDIDITVFNEDRENIIAYMLDKGWNVYEPLHATSSLRLITDPKDEGILNRQYVWAIKPSCSFIDIASEANEEGAFPYEILNEEQHLFDFMDIIFNRQQDGGFVCDESKSIVRKLDKAILHREGIPYLAPEIILFFISNPAYVESDYHREKTNADWKSIPPLLPKESAEWLKTAIQAAYPGGNKRLDELIALDQ